MFKANEFLARVYSDLERPFRCTKQGYWYYIYFVKKSLGLIDIETLKFEDDALAAFENRKTLCEKQSDSHLQIFHTDGGQEYRKGFDDCV